jgi:hypothetical protein
LEERSHFYCLWQGGGLIRNRTKKAGYERLLSGRLDKLRNDGGVGFDIAFASPNKTPVLGRGLCANRTCVQLTLRRHMKPTPNRPNPSSLNVAGSGTEVTYPAVIERNGGLL